jgi:aryl-alcohol dehydrogenase-like predicted oxidoreductase
MQYQDLGPLKNVSRLSLGGGGIGQVWGETDRDEALATVEASVAAGINLFDLAPMYGNGEAERVMGAAFANGYSDDIKLTTKCMLGDAPADEIEDRLRRSLDQSCERLNRDFVDVFILHGCVIDDGWSDALYPKVLPRVAVPWSKYRAHVIPAFQRLKEHGRIRSWGITAAMVPGIDLKVLALDETPDVVQCVANVMNTSGGMAMAAQEADHRAIINAATAAGCGVMGIRAVAAGSLTDAIDRTVKPTSPEQRDFDLAGPFRALAQELGVSTALLAHQYALAMGGVDTAVLGVKNRQELEQALTAESSELPSEVVQKIDALFS